MTWFRVRLFIIPIMIAGSFELSFAFGSCADLFQYVKIESYSDQTPSLKLSLGVDSKIELPRSLLLSAKESWAKLVRQISGKKSTHIEVEVWPSQEDGRLVLVWVRWRPSGTAAWNWFTETDSARTPTKRDLTKDREVIFSDFLELDSLYAKPVFSNLAFVDPRSGEILEGWIPPFKRGYYKDHPELLPKGEIFELPQPPTLDGMTKSVRLTVDLEANQIIWPKEVSWKAEPQITAKPFVGKHPPLALSSDPSFSERYLRDIRILSGEEVAEFPLSKKKMRFTRKSNADPKNQLEDVVDYLEERYAQLGIRTIRQRFMWRGIPQSNLIAVITGKRSDKPVLMADHIDTAFGEDVFDKTGERKSVPGADDNATATSALLRAAETHVEIARARQPEQDIWYLHLTGEEFPSDSLGARHFVSELASNNQSISGLVLLDMTGYRVEKTDPLFQISSGNSAESLRLAELALGQAATHAADWKGVIRTPQDPKNYLYNTDGIIFSDHGFPVILINEHLNALENINRRHYHHSSDISRRLDIPYATALTKVAIETVYQLAMAPTLIRQPVHSPSLPKDALKVPLVRQATQFSCGAAAGLSVLHYWEKYQGNETSLYKIFGTTPENGTHPMRLLKGLKSKGLQGVVKENLTFEDLRKILEEGKTVILAYQAWAAKQQTPVEWKNTQEEGHYGVLVGMDSKFIYLMDSSNPSSYTYVPLKEFWNRWHDYEVEPQGEWHYQRLGIIVWGEAGLGQFPGKLKRLE